RDHYLDPTGFYYMGARYYEPNSGRFLSPDPLGHDASLSLYDYCNGDPVNGLDADGRCVESGNAGAQAGWNNGNGNSTTYNPSSASIPAAYNLAWGLGAFDSYLNAQYVKPNTELLVGALQLANWGINTAGEAVGLNSGDVAAATVFIAPEAAALNAMAELNGVGVAAESSSTMLSTYRYTTEGETFFHYGYAEQSSGFQNGLNPGGFATTVSDLTGAEAKTGLALPRAIPPNAIYKVSPQPGTLIRVNPVAEPLFGQPGKLPEFQFPFGTTPGTVSGPTLIQ
ncbi:MAG: RHS repeat-associated core domain-containing protein, partial [Chthoniobacterales bacterium]